MGFWNLFKKKSASQQAAPSQTEHEQRESAKSAGWKLHFINEIQQDPDWQTKIDDEQRKQLITDAIKQNEYSASNWKVIIADKSPFFDYGMYGGESGAIFPINLRCICFQYGDDIYDVVYVCIDLKSGKPYLSVEKTCGGPGGSLITTYQQNSLSWKSFSEYAMHISDELRDYYTEISESNWQDYLNPKYVYFKL